MDAHALGRRAAVRALAGALLALPLAGCGRGGGDGPVLTVLAAASLADVLRAAREAYAAHRPGTRLRLSFAGSQELAAQVRQGIRADVLVTADTVTMDGLARYTGEPVVIARNELTLVTAPGNPLGIGGLGDLARPGLTVVLAAPEVPAGRAARRALELAGTQVAPASHEANVRAVLTKVTLGEADAGIVFVTDAAAAGDRVTEVPLPAGHQVRTAYPAATLVDAPEPAEAAAFVAWLTSDEAAGLLRAAGFGAP